MSERYQIEWRFIGETEWRSDGRKRWFTDRSLAERDRQLAEVGGNTEARIIPDDVVTDDDLFFGNHLPAVIKNAAVKATTFDRPFDVSECFSEENN